MNKSITEIYGLIQDLAWYFGNQGFDGTCCGDLTLVEYTTLKYVNDKNDSTMLDIANALNISKSGISKIVDRLESRGYVRREHSSDDGRVCCVGISSKGVEAVSKIIERYSEYMTETLANMDAVSIDNMLEVLGKLVSSVQNQGFIRRSNTKRGEC